MASSYSQNLAIELIGTGDQAGTWGVTTNTNLGTLIEQAISGYVTQAVSTGGDTTITIPNGATGVARNMYIELTGTGGANTNLIVPANKKLYFIFNNTASGQVTVKVAGETGVSVPNKAKMILVSNGTDIVDATNYVGNLSAASANITTLTSSSATITNLIATSASITTLTNNPTFGAGTANGVLYLNGSKVATSGSALTFDGTNFGVGSGTVDYQLTLNKASDTYIKVNNSGSSITAFYGASNTGGYVGTGTNHPVLFLTNGSEQMRLTSTGLGIGTSSPTFSAGGGVHISNATAANLRLQDTTTNVYTNIWQADNGSTSNFLIDVDPNNVGSGGCSLLINTAGSMKVTLSSSGNLGLGVTPSAWEGGYKAIQIGQAASFWGATGANFTTITNNAIFDGAYKYKNNGIATQYTMGTGGTHAWSIAPSGTAGNTITFTQAMTLDASGNLLVGKTASTVTTAGFGVLGTDGVSFTKNVTTSLSSCLYLNRASAVGDGTLVEFAESNNVEGTISVSGATVSYNAFAGSHWSQLQDGSKPNILRGTVMESINELCEWPGEENERLPKAKISDTAGSKKVYGVFMAWDNDWTTTNDMYVTAVGAFICRVNGSVTVQEGDLLESNGDGTARVQADDIIRSSTIGKVTSTVKTHEYDDGSYCVPTVLYCG